MPKLTNIGGRWVSSEWHKHPFAIPVVTFMVLFFASLVAFVVLNGETIGASDSKVIHLYIDGKEQILPTRAHTVQDVVNKAGLELREGDVIEPVLDHQIIDEEFNINIYRAKPVTVIDENGQKVTTKISGANAGDLAKKAGLNIYPEDNVLIAGADDALKDGIIGAKVIVDRATPVFVNLYGNPIETRTHAKTVGQLLDEKGIKAIDGDTVQPSPDTPIALNTQVFITSFGKQIASVEEEIPAPVEKINDPAAPAGSNTVKEPGSPGKKIVTYEIQLQNGREAARKPIQEVIAVQPVKRVVATGSKVTISNPSANTAIGERLAAARGWTGGEWLCLYQLWQKESKWNHLAGNRSSGAYGIPQALPGSKMATEGADWQTNPETQIRWGLGYIARSYKTPCAAWNKSRAVGWY